MHEGPDAHLSELMLASEKAQKYHEISIFVVFSACMTRVQIHVAG